MEASDTSPGTEPVVEPVVTPPEPPAEPVNTNPWDADLRQYLDGAEDPFEAASKYIAEKQQPRITQLEQQIAALPQEAQDLWGDLQNDPDGTIEAIVEARFGEDVAQRLKETPEPPDPNEPPDAEPAQQERDPEVQALLDEKAEAEAKAEYDALVEDIKAQPGRENINETLLAKHIFLTDGDVEQALQNLDAETDIYRQQFGVDPAAEPVVPPVPVIGSTDAAPAVPEPPKQYTSFDQLGDALTDMVDESKAGPAPPVGAV